MHRDGSRDIHADHSRVERSPSAGRQNFVLKLPGASLPLWNLIRVPKSVFIFGVKSMLRKFRKKPAYYSVHAMREGTIWMAVPHRKPYGKKSVTDEDGIFQWFLEEDLPSGMYEGACVQDT